MDSEVKLKQIVDVLDQLAEDTSVPRNIRRGANADYSGDFSLPLVAETWDGFLNDINGFTCGRSTSSPRSTAPGRAASPRGTWGVGPA